MSATLACPRVEVETLLPLTKDESCRLKECEKAIARGLATFYEVGNALAEIRELRLYRITHAAFSDYCQERWGMSRRRGDELIAAAAVVDNVRTNERNSAQMLPANEAQANELTTLEPEAQSEVWQRVVETAEKIGDTNSVLTAAHIKSVVREYLREHGEELPDDEPRKPRQKSDRSEVEALYEPEIQARLVRYIEVITEFENMEWPPELRYLLRMFQMHKSHVSFQRSRNLDDDCSAALDLLKRLSPDPRLGFEIAAQEHYDLLFDLGYCMSKKQYTERMKFMSQDDQRMALWTSAGDQAKQEGRRGALPGIVVLPWKKIWHISGKCKTCKKVIAASKKYCDECSGEEEDHF